MMRYSTISKKAEIRNWCIVYIIMGLLVAFCLLPLIYMVNMAFKPLHELFIFPPQFFVRSPTLKNFSDLLLAVSSSSVSYLRYLFNSLFVSGITVFVTAIMASLGGYSVVKMKPPGGGVIFKIVIAALMFPTQVTTIPRYLVIVKLGLVNNYLSLILPIAASAYYFFLMKQFIEQFPDSLLEAARIDGCGEFKIFRSIVMPALAPAWATLMVFSFVASWNDYFSPLIYISDDAMKTLPLALNTISGTGFGRAGATAASAMLMTVPVIIVFMFTQKKIMETMVYSGIKG